MLVSAYYVILQMSSSTHIYQRLTNGHLCECSYNGKWLPGHLQGNHLRQKFEQLWPGHDFCQGQMIHKPRSHELSILITAHCLDKINISVKFSHHIP